MGIPDVVRGVRDAVRARLEPVDRVVLAVSGGVDSMVLLDAAAVVAAERIAAVATFDHGTGAHARDAAALVRRESAARGLPVVVGRGELAAGGEAAWREARWRYLRATARDVGASAVATGHTRDDQVETVALRILRDAGPRGLAGLLAGAPDVVRPLLDVERRTVAGYAATRALQWLEDPSNVAPRHRRNRVRHELLPALRAAHRAIDDELLAVAARAAAWRGDVEHFVDANVALRRGAGGAFVVATRDLARYDAEELAVLWPAIAARAGVRLDRRGTVRLVEFTMSIAAGADVGAEIQLSGPVEVTAGRGEIVLRPWRPRPVVAPEAVGEVPLRGGSGEGVVVGRWRLRPGCAETDSPWCAYLPSDRSLAVRPWRAGDRMRVVGGQAARRVKRFFADARVPARERDGWPVVLMDDEIVWIPGVRRSDAATDRPGRPGVHFLCERIDG
ncbi:tRNA(Ile)-lysidine synthase [Gemmatirosa kalamazoonensis]|uniref:tRNA(Ile)-lysidine synthase n=1 Tax=Gemmatirosa kalamazoonensis TaxID=861299 RepID=W0RJG7_9BACT|nr:tRNA lysidine(34) synthetase TilS [Gemmatirosa kalamazoonensis]AHG90577.1 tRNA(Ile)-lysidine synthase [Gemmatirosa kalamazoonensis]